MNKKILITGTICLSLSGCVIDDQTKTGASAAAGAAVGALLAGVVNSDKDDTAALDKTKLELELQKLKQAKNNQSRTQADSAALQKTKLELQILQLQQQQQQQTLNQQRANNPQQSSERLRVQQQVENERLRVQQQVAKSAFTEVEITPHSSPVRIFFPNNWVRANVPGFDLFLKDTLGHAFIGYKFINRNMAEIEQTKFDDTMNRLVPNMRPSSEVGTISSNGLHLGFVEFSGAREGIAVDTTFLSISPTFGSREAFAMVVVESRLADAYDDQLEKILLDMSPL